MNIPKSPTRSKRIRTYVTDKNFRFMQRMSAVLHAFNGTIEEFEELHNLRFIHNTYGQIEEVVFNSDCYETLFHIKYMHD